MKEREKKLFVLIISTHFRHIQQRAAGFGAGRIDHSLKHACMHADKRLYLEEEGEKSLQRHHRRAATLVTLYVRLSVYLSVRPSVRLSEYK